MSVCGDVWVCGCGCVWGEGGMCVCVHSKTRIVVFNNKYVLLLYVTMSILYFHVLHIHNKSLSRGLWYSLKQL